MIHIAVDVGYSSVKAVGPDGEKHKFPSVVAICGGSPLRDAGIAVPEYSLDISQTPYIRNEGAQHLLIGEAAQQSRTGSSAFGEVKRNDIEDPLLFTAAYLAGANDDTFLATGLPLALWSSQKTTMQNRLEGMTRWVNVNNQGVRKIRFTRVAILPQALAAILSGPQLPDRGLVGTLDIGDGTTDFVLAKINNGVPIALPDMCFSVNIGIRQVKDRLADGFHDLTGSIWPSNQLDELYEYAVENRPVMFKGKHYNMASVFATGKKEVALKITEELKRAWASYMDRLDLVFSIGGGALLLKDDIRLYGDAIIADDPVFANAQGFRLLSASAAEALKSAKSV